MRSSACLLASVFLACAHGTAPTVPNADASPDGPPPGASTRERERDVDAGDVKLHLRIVGSDSASRVLLVVNGGPGVSYEYITGLDALAGAQRRVVYFDQRGVAPSTKPPSGDYTLKAYVADVDAVRVAVGAATIDLLGHSWGTAAAEAYAEAHPDRVRSLILVGPLAQTSDVQKRAFEKLGAYEESLIPLGLATDHPPEPVGDDCTARDKARIRRLFADPRHPQAGMHGSRCFVESRGKSFAAIEGWDFQPVASRLRGRVLVVTGAEDAFGQEPFEQTVRALSSAQVTTATLQHCGHMPFLETHAAIVARLEAWLSTDR